jgi:hypothetical protein
MGTVIPTQRGDQHRNRDQTPHILPSLCPARAYTVVRNCASVSTAMPKQGEGTSPTNNADIGKTIARLLALNIPAKGKLVGRELIEAMPNGAPPEFTSAASRSEPGVAAHVNVVLTQRVRDTRRSTLMPRAPPGRRSGRTTEVVATCRDHRPANRYAKGSRSGHREPVQRRVPCRFRFARSAHLIFQGWPFPYIARAHSESAVRSVHGGTRSMRGKWHRMEARARASSTTERESS